MPNGHDMSEEPGEGYEFIISPDLNDPIVTCLPEDIVNLIGTYFNIQFND